MSYLVTDIYSDYAAEFKTYDAAEAKITNILESCGLDNSARSDYKITYLGNRKWSEVEGTTISWIIRDREPTITGACWIDGMELTEDELDELNNNYDYTYQLVSDRNY